MTPFGGGSYVAEPPLMPAFVILICPVDSIWIVVLPLNVYPWANAASDASVGGSPTDGAFLTSVPCMFGCVDALPSHGRHERPDSTRSVELRPAVKPSHIRNSSFVCIGPSSLSKPANWMASCESQV